MEEFYIHKEVHPIWNVVTCKDLYGLAPNEKRFVQECADHYGAGEPAESIIRYTNRYFADDSGLVAGVDETLADGMKELSFEKDALIYDTLKANLYCVLLLEAIGQAVDDENASNLTSLIDKYSNGFKDVLDIQALSTALSNCPDVLKELFAVGKRELKGIPHRIATRYPKLFLAELSSIRNMPLTDTGSTPSSYKHNERYYKACIDAIKTKHGWVEKSFAQYYLFERTFREPLIKAHNSEASSQN